MNMNAQEQSVFYDCRKKISFVASVFSQNSPKIELNEDEMCGLFLVIVDVLRDLEAIENGLYNQPVTG